MEAVLKENPTYSDALSNKNRLAAAIDNSLNSNSSPSPDQSFNLNDPLLLSFAEDEVNYSNKRYFPKRSLSNSSIDFPSFGDQIDGGISSDQINLAEKAIISGNSQLALKLCSSILNDNAQDPRVFDLVRCISKSQ